MGISFDTVKNFFLGSSLSVLSDNFQKAAAEFGKVLYRDGSQVMQGDLDMNSRRIINHGYPVDDNDLATFAQVKQAANDISKGPPGSSDNTYVSLAAFKASDISRETAGLNRIPLISDGRFNWTLGNFTGLADDVNIIKADSTPLSVGAWVRQLSSGIAQKTLANKTVDANKFLNSLPLYAANYGVVDDPNVGTSSAIDQTAATQAFLDVCFAARRVANFGQLRVGIGSPGLVCQATGITFDILGNSTGTPGFYPLVGQSGYTVVKLGGSMLQVGLQVIGHGTVTHASDNTITSDTRPDVLGVELGGELNSPGGNLILSRIQCIRVISCRRNVRAVAMWDCTIDKIHSERGGVYDPANPNNVDNFDICIRSDAGGTNTTNESVFNYIQSEYAVGKAIYVDPNVLSCTFNKIHSERARAIAGTATWSFGGGSCSYSSVRLDATYDENPSGPRGTAMTGGASNVYKGIRSEASDCLYSAFLGATNTFIECGGSFAPAPAQNGRIVFIGGAPIVSNVDGFTSFFGSRLVNPSFGFAAAGQQASLFNCTVTNMTASSTQASVDLHGCIATMNSSSFRSIRLLDGTTLSPATGTGLTFAYQYVLVDGSSKVSANVTADFAGVDLKGTIDGTYNITTAARTIASSDARVTGVVTGFVPPNGGEFIGALYPGLRTKNLAWSPGQPPGWLYYTNGWHPEPVVA